MNNNKGKVSMGVMIASVIIAIGIGYLAATYSGDVRMMGDNESDAQQNEAMQNNEQRSTKLSNEEILLIIKQKFGDCVLKQECLKMTAEAVGEGESLLEAAITYEGIYDDSIAAQRVIVPITYDGGVWNVGEMRGTTWRCHEGRGHLDFSTENCI